MRHLFKNKILPYILRNKYGKPRIFLNTFRKHTHKWVSKNLDSKDIVLDIGARRFPYTRYQNVKALYGVDLISESEGYLGYSESDLARFNKIIIHPVVGNCEELPFANDSFDKIVICEVIEHIEKDQSAIAEMARVLNNSGKLLLTTPNGEEVENTNPYHFRHYQLEELQKKLEENFHDVKIKIKFPNINMLKKQFYPEDNYLSRIYWYFIYSIWLKLYGEKQASGGYTLFAVCGSPKNKNYNNDKKNSYMDIIACPKCKGSLEKEKDKAVDGSLYCSVCDIAYPVRKGIPILLTETPHHQHGVPL